MDLLGNGFRGGSLEHIFVPAGDRRPLEFQAKLGNAADTPAKSLPKEREKGAARHEGDARGHKGDGGDNSLSGVVP